MPAQKKWTLDECINYAMENNLTLKLSKLKQRSAQEDVMQSKAALFPTLSANTNQGVGYSPFDNTAADKAYYNGSYGVNAQWTVWNGGQNTNTIKQNKLTEEQAGLSTDVTANSLQEQITKLYVQILYMSEAIEVNRQSLETSKKNEERVEQFWHDADKIFSGYLRGQFIDASIVCVLTGVVFLIVGVPEAILIALLVGIGNLIPYVGPIVGYCAVTLVCLATGSYHELVVGLVSLLIIMVIDGNIINPRLLSNNIKIHPLLVVAALIGGGALGGFVGMLVAVPVAALLKLYFDRFLAKKESEDNN